MLKNPFRSKSRQTVDTPAAPIIGEVSRRSLTYLDTPALNDLYLEAQRIEKAGIDGLFIEAGCALGGSAIVIASAKAAARSLFVYDVFGMIPPPSERDGSDVRNRYKTILSGKAEGLGGHQYYGYEEGLLDKVRKNFESCGIYPRENHVEFLQGLFQDTLHINEPVALAHIDGDWYDSVMICLERIAPHLQAGGTLVIDDYYHWSGCRRAVDDYFSAYPHDFRFVDRSRLHIQCCREPVVSSSAAAIDYVE